MLREKFRELLSERLNQEEKPKKISQFSDIVRVLSQSVWGRADKILESQMEGIANAYIVAISELIFFHIKEALRGMAEESEVEGRLDLSDLRAALISFLGELWDRKIKHRVHQIHHFPKEKQDELKSKFIERILSRFAEFVG